MKTAKVLITVILLLFFVPLTAYAEDGLKDIYDGLPEDVCDSLPKDFEEKISEGDGSDAVKSIDSPFILSFISKCVSGAAGDALPSVVTLTVMIILSALISSVGKENDGTVGKALSFASSLSVTAACIGVILPLWEQTLDALKALSGIVKTSLPIMTAISASSGQLSSGAVNATWLNAVLALIEELSVNVLSPLFTVCLSFFIISALTDGNGTSLSGVAVSIKKLFTFFITLISAILCAVMTFQSIIAKGSDTVLLRSIRFASSSAVPIVGGALSEAAGTYLSGLSVIKSSAGALVAASIALSALPLLLKLFAVKIGLSIVAFSGEILGVKADTVRSFTSLIDLMIALLILCSAVFVIAAGVFASVLPS